MKVNLKTIKYKIYQRVSDDGNSLGLHAQMILYKESLGKIVKIDHLYILNTLITSRKGMKHWTLEA